MIVLTRAQREQKAQRLEVVADWFTDCKNLTLENLPEGLIADLRAGAESLRVDPGEGWQAPAWTARLSEIEWSGRFRGHRCCPACGGTHPDASIELYGMGTRTNEGHKRTCWIYLALINEVAPPVTGSEKS